MGWRPFQSPRPGQLAARSKELAPAVAISSRGRQADMSDSSTAISTPNDLSTSDAGNGEGSDVAAAVVDRPVERFDPAPIHPLSPAAQIVPGPLPKGYQARMDELQKLGKQLAESVSSTRRTFQFDTVYNPRRADTLHTEAGHILVTSAFLERVETRHQLAGALAMEMAEVLREDQQSEDKAEQAVAGVPAAAIAAKVSVSNEADIHATASKILARSGFDHLDLSALSRDLKGMLVVSNPPAAALPTVGGENTKAETSGPEPAWSGPQPSLAN
jgi:hypothetical protein